MNERGQAPPAVFEWMVFILQSARVYGGLICGRKKRWVKASRPLLSILHLNPLASLMIQHHTICFDASGLQNKKHTQHQASGFWTQMCLFSTKADFRIKSWPSYEKATRSHLTGSYMGPRPFYTANVIAYPIISHCDCCPNQMSKVGLVFEWVKANFLPWFWGMCSSTKVPPSIKVQTSVLGIAYYRPAFVRPSSGKGRLIANHAQ